MSRLADKVRKGVARVMGYASEPAQYTSGNLTIPVDVILAGADPKAEASDGVVVRQSLVTILVKAETLVVNSQQHWPITNDMITLDDGRRYRVVADPMTRKAWRWSDGTHAFMRVNVDEAVRL